MKNSSDFFQWIFLVLNLFLVSIYKFCKKTNFNPTARRTSPRWSLNKTVWATQNFIKYRMTGRVDILLRGVQQQEGSTPRVWSCAPRVWSALRVWSCATRVWNEFMGRNSDLTIEIHNFSKCEKCEPSMTSII